MQAAFLASSVHKTAQIPDGEDEHAKAYELGQMMLAVLPTNVVVAVAHVVVAH